MSGIASYANGVGWLLEEMPATPEALKQLEGSRCDGVIAHVLDENFLKALDESGRSTVSVSSSMAPLPFPAVDVDHLAVGRLAAEYFLKLRSQDFAFFGSAIAGFSKEREKGFREVVEDHGFEVRSAYSEYRLRPPYDQFSREAEEELKGWILDLPKPISILCSNDEHARILSFLCQSSGIAVPEEVSLLGVDNDQVICALCSPPISSVDNPAEEIGYRSAEILDRLFKGKLGGLGRISVSPAHVVERQSTDRLAVDDPVVRKANSFIKRNLREVSLGVEDVADHISVSRRSLERVFSKVLGATVLEVIHRYRIRRAKTLLYQTDLAITTIASECGFSNHRRFAIVFKSYANLNPSQYRQLCRFSGKG